MGAEHLTAWRDKVTQYSKQNNVSLKDAMNALKDPSKPKKEKKSKCACHDQTPVQTPVLNKPKRGRKPKQQQGEGFITDLLKPLTKPLFKII